MPTCSFCKKNYENPRGLTLFTNDGKSLFYCSSKCRRNADLGRDPKKTSWVKKELKIKEKAVKDTIKKEEKVTENTPKEEKKESDSKKE